MKTKTFRKLHSSIIIFFVAFFIIISLSGLILAWKKNSAVVLLPKTEKGISKDMGKWLSIASLKSIAVKCLKDSVSNELSARISKIDIRPNKGIAKFIFKNNYYEIQVDCTNGNVLAVNKRNSDWIEDIHDDSIIDRFFEIKGNPVKVIYSTLLALGSMFMTFTGIVIWAKRRKLIKQKVLKKQHN